MPTAYPHTGYPCANPKCHEVVCDDEDCLLEMHGTAHHRFAGDGLSFCGDCIDKAERDWLRGRVAELERHGCLLHKAAAAGRDAERAAAVEFLRRPCGSEGHDDRWCETCAVRDDLADAIESGKHRETP